VLANHGRHSHQEVMHLHVHIFGGRALGPMLEGGSMPPDGTFTRG
jgi:diadenosine tetraphosphate (Ap4A) HIT family hydrolase